MVASPASTTVTLLHFSDYHSHALPFWNDHQPGQAGISRAIRYLRQEKHKGALVFSGGDMMNHGSPAWSDKYQCAEWAWLNGIVDVMAFGNHDADYGSAKFQECRRSVRFPILSANTMNTEENPILLDRGKPYSIFTHGSVRIGVFAIAGRDFETLVKPENRPVPGARFGDPVAAAREMVRALREEQHVAAVIMIGHQSLDDDFALARTVPGIDVIFGTHSHLERELMQIPGTSTWFISPSQYLTRISRIQLSFEGQRLAGVKGSLVRMSTRMKEDSRMTARVKTMQRQLEEDPAYAPLFQPVGLVTHEISNEGQNEKSAPLGNLVTDVMREASKADVAIVTSSSFRQSLPPGTLLRETLRASMPYENEVLVYRMTGVQLSEVVRLSLSRSGTDAFSQISGMTVRGSRTSPSITVGGAPLDGREIYRVAVTNFQALVAEGYREIFAPIAKENSGLKLRETFERHIEAAKTIWGTSEERIQIDQ